MATHLEILVEEPSMEAFLNGLLPRCIPAGRTFAVYPHGGKDALLGKLGARLRGYAHWLPADWRILVAVDRDSADCKDLKARLEREAAEAGMVTRSSAHGGPWVIANRVVVEELEAWYFGDWHAVCCAYPKAAHSTANQSRYRDADAVAGGTWEAFERLLQRHGYFAGGLSKLEAARAIAPHVDPARSRSRSFAHFMEVVREALG